MHMNHFPKVQPLLFQSLSSSFQFKPRHYDPIEPMDFTQWQSPSPSPSTPPFCKSKTLKHLQVDPDKEDKFQQLLKRIEKVKQDYEEEHSGGEQQQKGLTYSLKVEPEEKLAFKTGVKHKSASPKGHYQQGKHRGSKGRQHHHHHHHQNKKDAIIDNSNISSGKDNDESNFSKSLKRAMTMKEFDNNYNYAKIDEVKTTNDYVTYNNTYDASTNLSASCRSEKTPLDFGLSIGLDLNLFKKTSSTSSNSTTTSTLQSLLHKQPQPLQFPWQSFDIHHHSPNKKQQPYHNEKGFQKNKQNMMFVDGSNSVQLNIPREISSHNYSLSKTSPQRFGKELNLKEQALSNTTNCGNFVKINKLNFDLKILEKVPVRQSINLDAENLISLQNTYMEQNQLLYGVNTTSQPSPRSPLQFSDFQVGNCIGSGKFGQVYLCRHKRTNFICALKKIMKSTIEEYKMVDQFVRQLKISYMVDHPNVIKTYGHFHDEFHVFLLMEYAGDGCVIDGLEWKKGEEFSGNVVFQTLKAVEHLHRRKIVHRDIKPQNIVVFFKNTYKLCDFGLSAFVDNDMKHTFCGTPDYLSPQMKDIGEYDFSVDLWSLGVLAYQLIMGQAPFKEKISEWKKSGWKKSSYWTWKIDYPKEISGLAKQFMQGLLKEKPQERASIWSCLRHDFVKKHAKKQMDVIKMAEISGF